MKIEKVTPGKPEVLQVSVILGIHPTHAFGLCVKFWIWCDDQLHDGNARGVTGVTLDYIIGHIGFTNALVKVGWLRDRSGSLEVPHFDRHLSDSAKNRALTKERVKLSRDKSNENIVTNVTQKALPEKRREEKSTLVDKSTKETPTPLPFENPDFLLFWGNWEKHRKEKKQTLTPTARKQQLEKLKTMGETRAIAALKHSLANGWTGVHEPRDFDAKPSGNRTQTYLERHPNHAHLEITENPL